MDTVLRGAQVIDGTGAPSRHADVVVRGGRVTAIGPPGVRPPAATDVVDLDGLMLAPGFVDVHTHFDAQVLWDPDLTPSTGHGVTTAVFGNCGFGIAPVRPEGREVIVRTLENVEGMSAEALFSGIDWTFETFPEYLDVIDSRPTRCNVGVMVGHSPVRLYVMGDEGVGRAATHDEVARMRRLVDEALAAGALGLSSSVAPVHVGAWGRPVPSRLADASEIVELARSLKVAGQGVMQLTAGPTFGPVELSELYKEIGRPVLYAAVLTGFHGEETAEEVVAAVKDRGGEVWPTTACKAVVFQFTMRDPFPFANTLPSFRRVMAVGPGQRPSIYADPAWREQARKEAAGSPEWQARWPKTTVAETVRHEGLRGGSTVAELARERGADPFDLVVDLALEDDLSTRFRTVLFQDDPQAVGRLLRDPATLISLSDAGAHASQLCDADYGTHLLQHWVRELGILSMEEAVHKLTSVPAGIFGLTDRGVIAPGSWADLIAFDPDTVGTEPPERVWDLPADADRLVARSRGIEWTWVNGTAIRAAGNDVVESRPGVLIRGGH